MSAPGNGPASQRRSRGVCSGYKRPRGWGAGVLVDDDNDPDALTEVAGPRRIRGERLAKSSGDAARRQEAQSRFRHDHLEPSVRFSDALTECGCRVDGWWLPVRENRAAPAWSHGRWTGRNGRSLRTGLIWRSDVGGSRYGQDQFIQ